MRAKVSTAAFLSLLAGWIAPLYASDVILRGKVVDETDAPVREARVTLRSASTGSWETQTDPTGAFTLTVAAPGDFLISVAREGYYALKDRPIHIDAAQELTLSINNVREVFQSENVNAETSPVDVSQTQSQEQLTGTEVNDMPYANSHNLRNALQLMPGVLQDATGNLHVNGASESQVLYLLNGFNITNPISGQFQTVLAVEAVRSVELASGRYSPEFGKGSAGVLAVNTQNGTDAFHYTATDFIPGLRVQQGLQFGNWYPRLGVSGPIVRGRAWFSDTFDSEYTSGFVPGLPKGQDTRTGWTGSNLLHTQVNLTAANILFADFLANISDQSRVGLGPLNPVSATSTVDTREYLFSVKDQVYLGRGVLVEFGYGHTYFSNLQTPQGPNLYVISPEGNSGNYFLNSSQTAARDQGMIHVYLPQFQLFGAHHLEAGGEADVVRYTGNFHRTGYQVLGLFGQPISQTLFPTPAQFDVGDSQVAAYLMDTWRVSKSLQFSLGVRQDWDQKVSDLAWSPRLGFSWSPFASGHTRISGGYLLTHDTITMDIFGRPLDQTAVTTTYSPNGGPAGPPGLTTFTIGNAPLVLPRASNWTLDVTHQVSAHVHVTAKYLRRRGTDEFAFINALAPNAPPSLLPLPSVDTAAIYQLTNLRRDEYDSIQMSIRQKFTGQYEWMASYTRSRAVSNAVLDPNITQPLQVLSNLVPMPWDAPNRLLAWAYFPLPRKNWGKNWAISALVDMRSGFPFSVRYQTGIIAGPVDSFRYPMNFDLNLAIERMITLHGYRFALRGGINNLTNQTNPTAVNNVIGAPQFLQVLGAEGRHFVVRVRFFGRAQK
ncbi:MAG TPA: TonB-dependent receptor [Bryobacteraceae bacterium]|nr:TonB-dependent receptor [Bryobacteraceae bacterium]